MANLQAEFVLQDDKENDVYRSAIALPPKPGIISVSIPATIAPLRLDKTYRWDFKIACNQPATGSVAKNSTVPIKVDGYIQRINPHPKGQDSYLCRGGYLV